MNKQAIEKYTDTEIKNGKTHQEIFNTIAAKSDYNIHDIADIVRKVPTLEKRKRFGNLNLVLSGILLLAIISRLLTGILEIMNGHSDADVIALFFPVVTILLMFGVYKYRRNAHLAAGLFMTLGSVMAIIRLINNFDFFALLDILITLFGATTAFYLNSKLVGDYVLDKELQESNPQQRENVLKFTE